MPLFLLYLSNIGDIMAKSFKWIYAKVCLCRICPGVAKRRESRNRRKLRALQRELNEDYDENVSHVHKNFIDMNETQSEKLFHKLCNTQQLYDILSSFHSVFHIRFNSSALFLHSFLIAGRLSVR